MGTNYYAAKENEHLPEDFSETLLHIGKRSASGAYCWDCRLTLCKEGEDHVHEGKSEWHEVCPRCGNAWTAEGLEHSSAGRELGFNKGPFVKKTGVKSCSSFTWAMKPDKFDTVTSVVDEYGRRHTLEEFKQILDECPIRYYNSIGIKFC